MAQQLCQCQLTVVRFFPTAMSTAVVRHQLRSWNTLISWLQALEIWQKAAVWLLWSHYEITPLSIPDILEAKSSPCACKIINYLKEQNYNCHTPIKCDHKWKNKELHATIIYTQNTARKTKQFLQIHFKDFFKISRVQLWRSNLKTNRKTQLFQRLYKADLFERRCLSQLLMCQFLF